MKATEFVKKFGISIAEVVVCEAPSWAKSYFTGIEEYERGDFSTVFDDCVSVDELKRLVESHELVKELGGFERVKRTIALSDKKLGYTHVYLHSNNFYCFIDDYVDFIPDKAITIKTALKAITDVEACQ